MDSTNVDPGAIESALQDATSLADVARELALSWFRSPGLDVSIKADGSPVTSADLEIEQTLRSLIGERYPDDAIVGEELADSEGEGRQWIIDPIDGTRAFSHGVPLFASMIAVRIRGSLAAAVIDAPALGERAWGALGMGVRVNDGSASLSQVNALEDALVTTSGLGDYWPDGELRRLESTGARVRTWADGGYGYLQLLAGRVDAVIERDVDIWDVAPPLLLVAEAGGVVRRPIFGNQTTGMVATTEPLARPLSDALGIGQQTLRIK